MFILSLSLILILVNSVLVFFIKADGEYSTKKAEMKGSLFYLVVVFVLSGALYAFGFVLTASLMQFIVAPFAVVGTVNALFELIKEKRHS